MYLKQQGKPGHVATNFRSDISLHCLMIILEIVMHLYHIS
jgi:hypothetical protein